VGKRRCTYFNDEENIFIDQQPRGFLRALLRSYMVLADYVQHPDVYTRVYTLNQVGEMGEEDESAANPEELLNTLKLAGIYIDKNRQDSSSNSILGSSLLSSPTKEEEKEVKDKPITTSGTKKKSSCADALITTDWSEIANEILAKTKHPSAYIAMGVALAEQTTKTGRITDRRVVTALYQPLWDMEQEFSSEAFVHGLRAALAADAPNANYVRKAAEGYAADHPVSFQRPDENKVYTDKWE